MTLPGIGETQAQDILDYRQQIGSFTNLEELMNVRGIGQSTFDKLKMYITIVK
jgi:competence protein ComEA